MWKWILKKAIIVLAEPIVDTVIFELERLAKGTSNTIDDEFVNKFKEFKEDIVGFIIAQCGNIVKAV